MTARLEWHKEAAASRDARFSFWAEKKAAAWQVDLDVYLSTGAGDLEAIIASRWKPCPSIGKHDSTSRGFTHPDGVACGKMFQPGLRDYHQCYACSVITSRLYHRTSCVICMRSHQASFQCCVACQAAGREDLAVLLRSVVLRRDGFKCNICNTDEGQMDVHHINPQGSAWAWNLEVLCVSCGVTLAGSKAYGALDELVWLERATAYSTYLADYLDGNETEQLRVQLKENLGGDYAGPPPLDRAVLAQMITGANLGVCDEIDGMLNAAHVFNPTEVTHV